MWGPYRSSKRCVTMSGGGNDAYCHRVFCMLDEEDKHRDKVGPTYQDFDIFLKLNGLYNMGHSIRSENYNKKI